jgi:hypothetical protein
MENEAASSSEQEKTNMRIANVAVLLVPALLVIPQARAQGVFGPDTCSPGYVWRGATPADHVCVTPATRTATETDNQQAASRRVPGGGAYGPDTCKVGFVWRGVTPTDHTCVSPQTRDQVKADNAAGPTHRLMGTSFEIGPPKKCATHAVYGLIGQHYADWGGSGGPLGCPLSDEMDTPGGHGRYNQFEHGQIVFSPSTGGQSIQILFADGGTIYFFWGPTDPYSYGRFLVRWDINGKNAGQQDVNGGSQGGFQLHGYDPKAYYSFVVEGCDNGTISSFCRQGWSNPATLGKPVAPPPVVQPPVITVTAFGKGAGASFQVNGTGFLDGAKITVRLVDDQLHTVYFYQNADGSGRLSMKVSEACNSGFSLHWSATDLRPDPNVTGSLWSNTFTLLCP